MKRQIVLISIATFFLFSCSKEDEATIVGDWIEEAVYGEGNSGYQWMTTSGAYEYISLKADGKYLWGNSRCGNGTGGGAYKFSYTARELKFGDDNFNSVSTYKIETLDENNIILISPYVDNVYRLRIKFRRQ